MAGSDCRSVLGSQLGEYSVSAGRTVFCFPELSPNIILFQDNSGNASFFSSLPPFMCNFLLLFFWFICFPLLFQVCIPVLHCKYNPSAFLLVPDFLLKSEKCGFYSKDQIGTRTTKITRKDLIFLKQNSVLILSVYVFMGE